MRVLAFGASAARQSINKTFAHYTAQQLGASSLNLFDLSSLDLPLYTVDVEREKGIPQAVKDFYAEIAAADLLLISLAEHNGTYTTAFKNLFDWLSRHQSKNFADKPMLLLSTSPGGRGGKGVMEAALVRFPIHGGRIVASFSLPNFGTNFSLEAGVTDAALAAEYAAAIAAARAALGA